MLYLVHPVQFTILWNYMDVVQKGFKIYGNLTELKMQEHELWFTWVTWAEYNLELPNSRLRTGQGFTSCFKNTGKMHV